MPASGVIDVAASQVAPRPSAAPTLSSAALSLAVFLAAVSAEAQQLAEDAALGLELNNVADVDGACRLTFLVSNETGSDITSLVFETVIFTSDSQVERLTLFDFQSVPSGSPRVRQFDLTGVSCDGLAQILINGVDTCEGDGLAPETCQSALRTSSRADIEVAG